MTSIYMGPDLKPQPAHSPAELARVRVYPPGAAGKDWSPVPWKGQAFLLDKTSPRDTKLAIVLEMIRAHPGITSNALYQRGVMKHQIHRLSSAGRIKWRVLRGPRVYVSQYALPRDAWPAVPEGLKVMRSGGG